MINYFATCGGFGFLWVRLNSRPNGDITTFATHVLPKMTKPFTLITTDGDNSVPSKINHADAILNNPLCTTWYTQNYDGTSNHSKLKPIPIGFDLHTSWEGLWSKDVPTNFAKMLLLRDESLQRTRDAIPFVPPWSDTHGERLRSDQALACLEHMHGDHMGIGRLWDTYGSKRFAVSPRGAGLDAHRTWELLFFGTIPIVKTSSLDQLYQELPVIIVQDWKDVCKPGFLDAQWEYLKPKWPMSLEKFQLQYWINNRQASASTSVSTSVSTLVARNDGTTAPTKPHTPQNQNQNKPTLVVMGMTRNNYEHQSATIATIQRQTKHFDIVKVIVYENDSTDKTLEGLQTWSKQLNIPVEIISETNVPGNRIQRLVIGRNVLLNAVWKVSPDPDYILLLDMDEVVENLEGVETCLDLPDQWGVCCTNQRDVYYDLWALRTLDNWCDCDVWYDSHCAATRERKYRFISQDSPPIEVKSCFGGAALYNYKQEVKPLVQMGAHYEAFDYGYFRKNEINTCEHVLFHQMMHNLNTNFKVYIQPRMLNTAPTQHIPLPVMAMINKYNKLI
jgi:hypothetical protein